MNKEQHTHKTALRALVVAVWAAVIVLCVCNRDKISVDGIVSLSPGSTAVAVCLMLVLFALKSMTVVIYCGILYAASGILFPLPLALAVNYAGTAIMVTIPFYVGRGLGHEGMEHLVQKHPKLAFLSRSQDESGFTAAFFSRIIGLLPSDPISAYMGAAGLRYREYILGTMLGMTPSVAAFTVMGTSVHDVHSPAFLASVGCILAVSAVAVIVISHRRRRQRTAQ